MTDLQKEFEATGYTSWINLDLYPDGKIYTQEYTQWLEAKVKDASLLKNVSGSFITNNEARPEKEGFYNVIYSDAQEGVEHFDGNTWRVMYGRPVEYWKLTYD
jgi:hypothetical protein